MPKNAPGRHRVVPYTSSALVCGMSSFSAVQMPSSTRGRDSTQFICLGVSLWRSQKEVANLYGIFWRKGGNYVIEFGPFFGDIADGELCLNLGEPNLWVCWPEGWYLDGHYGDDRCSKRLWQQLLLCCSWLLFSHVRVMAEQQQLQQSSNCCHSLLLRLSSAPSPLSIANTLVTEHASWQ